MTILPRPGSAAAAAILALTGTTCASAATQLGEYFSLSGFGTLGVVRSNSDEGEFVRASQAKGATRDADAGVDSNLGIQLTGKAAPWLSGTLQALAARRRSEEQVKVEAEWAFLKAQPTEGLEFRAGRMPLAAFLVSDFRNVGYSNTWVRAPNEVYSLSVLERLRGGDVSWRTALGPSSLTLAAQAGTSSIPANGFRLQVDNVRSYSVTWEGDGISARAGRITADVRLGSVGLPDDKYTFTGIGMAFDRSNVVAQAEVVTRRSSGQSDLVDAKGWYVLGGYRLGRWLPYVTVAKETPKTRLPFALAGPQTTRALGLRWDAFASAAIKLQWERVDTDGTHGASFHTPTFVIPNVPIPGNMPVTRPVNVLSATVDFVF